MNDVKLNFYLFIYIKIFALTLESSEILPNRNRNILTPEFLFDRISLIYSTEYSLVTI